MSLASLFVLVLHVFVKPYQNMYINIIETAILLNLLMCTAGRKWWWNTNDKWWCNANDVMMISYLLSPAFLDPSNSPVPEWFTTTLVLLPYFYAVGYLIWRLSQYAWWVQVCVQINLTGVPAFQTCDMCNTFYTCSADSWLIVSS